MTLVDSGDKLLQLHRTIIDDAVLIVLQRSDEVYKLLRILLLQLCAAGNVAESVVRSVHTVGLKSLEVGLLVELVVLTRLQRCAHEAVVSLTVSLGVVDDVLHEIHCLLHVLAQTAE